MNHQFSLIKTTSWQYLASKISKMAPALIVTPSLRVGEELAIVLGFGLSTAAVAMRLWVKARLTKAMMLEDYFSLAAWLSFLAYIALAIVIGTSGGDAVHKAYVCLDLRFSAIVLFCSIAVADLALKNSSQLWSLPSTVPSSSL